MRSVWLFYDGLTGVGWIVLLAQLIEFWGVTWVYWAFVGSVVCFTSYLFFGVLQGFAVLWRLCVFLIGSGIALLHLQGFSVCLEGPGTHIVEPKP